MSYEVDQEYVISLYEVEYEGKNYVIEKWFEAGHILDVMTVWEVDGRDEMNEPVYGKPVSVDGDIIEYFETELYEEDVKYGEKSRYRIDVDGTEYGVYVDLHGVMDDPGIFRLDGEEITDEEEIKIEDILEENGIY